MSSGTHSRSHSAHIQSVRTLLDNLQITSVQYIGRQIIQTNSQHKQSSVQSGQTTQGKNLLCTNVQVW